MNRQRNPHLDEAQLLRAVVDSDDLPVSARTHLSECEACMAAQVQLESGLLQLGRTAERFTPPPLRSVSLPEVAVPPPRFWWIEWRYFRTVGAVAACVTLLLLASFFLVPSHENGITKLKWEIRKDAKLMKEISRLEENALPVLYSEIADDSDPDLSEDFIEFIVPDSSSKPVSERRRERLPRC